MIETEKNMESRIDFAAGVLLLSAALIAGAFLFSFGKESCLSKLETERAMVETAVVRQGPFIEKMVSGRGEEAGKALRRIAAHEKVLGAGWYDSDGRLVAQDVLDMSADFHNPGFPPDLSSLGERNGLSGDGRVAFLATPFEDRRGKVAHIGVFYSVERIVSDFSDSTVVLVSSLAACVLFLFFAIRIFLEHTVTGSTRKLAETLRLLYGRDGPAETIAKAGSELSAALRWFNFVSGENAGMKRELSQLNAVLEEKVRERTRQSDEANKAKTAFLANVSHELRTPLNAILGFTNIIGKNRDLPEQTLEQLAIVRRSGEYLLLLINEILDLSKIEAGQMELNEEPMDLRRLLWELENMFKMKAANKNLRFAFELEDNLPRYIVADELKLRQVLTNLIDNAVKFTKEGGIRLRAGIPSLPDENIPVGTKTPVRFEVEDTGVGISSDEKKDLFKAFVQTRSGQKSRQGTGLGLAISSQFVKMMESEIEVESMPGKGSIFSFAIPLTTIQPDDIEAADHSTSLSTPGKRYGKETEIDVSEEKDAAGIVRDEGLSDLLDELREAARKCDLGEVEKCIRQVRSLNCRLADELSELAADYNYDIIVERIRGNRR